jgi:hypothetical protein
MCAIRNCAHTSFTRSIAARRSRSVPPPLSICADDIYWGVQYEIISNPETVDLLVSIAYTAAADQSLGEPLPLGMGLRVPVPDPRRCFAPPVASMWTHMAGAAPAVPAPVRVTPVPGDDGLCEFDEMGILEVCR